MGKELRKELYRKKTESLEEKTHKESYKQKKNREQN
jgi:hypothetical protein